MLSRSEDIVVIEKSETIEECRTKLDLLSHPDVLLLDIEMREDTNFTGIDFCEEVHKKYPDIKIMMLTSHYAPSFVGWALHNGALGYVLKTVASEELIEGIKAIAKGKQFLCKEVKKLMEEKKKQIKLSVEEHKFLVFLSEGFTVEKTAEKLHLTVDAIKKMSKRVKEKLGAKNAPGTVRIAIALGFIIIKKF